MINPVANLERVRSRIAEAEERFGRLPGGVCLLAVSKFHGADVIAQTVPAGQRHFAENYLQELRDKRTALAELFPKDTIQWHFTGRVQSKKARVITTLCDWVHSIDRIEVARKLSEHRPMDAPPLNICVQVNLDDEAGKSGIPPSGLEGLLEEVTGLPNLNVRGLMAIPKPQQGFDDQRKSFARLRHLFEAQRHGPSWDTLSMGMSADFEAAIAEGATIVRIGTTLFGPRQ